MTPRPPAPADQSESIRDTVAELISDRLSSMKPSERKIARALIADYPAAGLGTVASLASAASVSAPSVLRFVTALGFTSFSTMQDSLKNELRVRAEGPVSGIVWELPPGSESERLVSRAETMTANAVQSLRAIPPDELNEAIRLLRDTSRRVFMAGGRYSNILARHLAQNLETIRPKVRFVEHPFDDDLGDIISLSTRDIFVLFDFHRYQRSTIELARLIRRRGATIILITDERLSPAATDAQVVLPISVSAPTPFYSFAAGILLMELLVYPVLLTLGSKGRDYLEKWDALRSRELVSTSREDG